MRYARTDSSPATYTCLVAQSQRTRLTTEQDARRKRDEIKYVCDARVQGDETDMTSQRCRYSKACFAGGVLHSPILGDPKTDIVASIIIPFTIIAFLMSSRFGCSCWLSEALALVSALLAFYPWLFRLESLLFFGLAQRGRRLRKRASRRRGKRGPANLILKRSNYLLDESRQDGENGSVLGRLKMRMVRRGLPHNRPEEA